MALANRMARELKMLEMQPPPGVSAWPDKDSLTHLRAQIDGPEGTVYEGGCFDLSIVVPQRYPFEPPEIKFMTKVYHPNIDQQGRICLDLLNLPPKGAWKPSLNLSTLLMSLGVLLGDPNPHDGLVAETTEEFLNDRCLFDQKARAWTQRYAVRSAKLADGRDVNSADGSQAGDDGSLGQNGEQKTVDECGARVEGSMPQVPITGAEQVPKVDAGNHPGPGPCDQDSKPGQDKRWNCPLTTASPLSDAHQRDEPGQGAHYGNAAPQRFSRLKRAAPQQDAQSSGGLNKCSKQEISNVL